MNDQRKFSVPGKSPAHMKRQRAKQGAVSRREIFKLQKTTNISILAAAFEKLVRDIAQDIKYDIRFQRDAVNDLQHASEGYLIERFQKGTRAARHAGGITVQDEDIHFVNILCDK